MVENHNNRKMRDSENMKGSKGEPPLQNEKKSKLYITINVTSVLE
jgi:hypothetical protein